MTNIFELKNKISGDFYCDHKSLTEYSTDASVYKEKPLAVVRPKNISDIKECILFARENKLSVIPRGAGTSLAGQVVGGGIVVDISKHWTKILEVNKEQKWVRVQPGVVLDELNKYLENYGLFFGPETSTSNRCNIAGMVGNNSCGSHSILYGSTRDHMISLQTILSDGSEVEFKKLTTEEYEKKILQEDLEGEIYRNINGILSDPENQKEIRKEFPDASIKRRNTGYAIDLLLETQLFSSGGEQFNFCKLLAGSEGTLAFTTEIKLNLVDIPPKEKAVVCVHCNTLEEAFEANLVGLNHKPGAIELIDKYILDCTKGNIGQSKNRFFIEGDPAAILVVEFARESKEEIDKITSELIEELQSKNMGYHYPVLYGQDINKVWALRKAGLGLLSNVPGDAKPVAVIEDTAVNPQLLPKYMSDFKQILDKYKKECVYYAHIATGELHLRPVLNLKDPADVQLFHDIAEDIARLVKKYRGSLSGEHGDGRLRGEFIPFMLGEKNYNLLKKIKRAWDPLNIFNPRKIVDTPRMNESLRYKPGQETKQLDTIFDFSNTLGYLRAVEQCNGSADCRKSSLIGGTMCPSYMATKDENTTTRARANILREFITNSNKENPFDHKEIYDVLDLCLSCKGCKSECPSNVDMAKLKAEFLQHYYDSNGIPLRAKIIANITFLNRLGSLLPWIYNLFLKTKIFANLFKNIFDIAKERSLPLLYKTTLKSWFKKSMIPMNNPNGKKLYLFIDEFTNYNDVEVGIKSVELLNRLGYNVNFVEHPESGRTFISKGMVRNAKELAVKNVVMFKDFINNEVPLIGIEPSAILSFRDEYPDLVGNELKNDALKLADNCLIIDEFISREIEAGNITREMFSDKKSKNKITWALSPKIFGQH